MRDHASALLLELSCEPPSSHGGRNRKGAAGAAGVLLSLICPAAEVAHRVAAVSEEMGTLPSGLEQATPLLAPLLLLTPVVLAMIRLNTSAETSEFDVRATPVPISEGQDASRLVPAQTLARLLFRSSFTALELLFFAIPNKLG